MRSPLEQSVLGAIRGARMMVPGDRVGVAVSGGADSVALLRLLEGIRDALGITLLVVHFDHSLRGAESEADARFVAELAAARGLQFILAKEDAAAEAARLGLNLEDAARRLRYSFFERVVAEGRATRIATAHTADDQAETVLARLFRGTGPAGLAGIYPLAGHVVRPLLATRRAELRAYLRELGQSWREDSTNRDLRRQRARIREQLLPVLERDYSPRVTEHLAELARLSREEETFWAALVEDRVHAIARPWENCVGLGVRIADLLSPLAPQPGSPSNAMTSATSAAADPAAPYRALTERLIRRLYQEARGNRHDLAAAHVEQVIHLARSGASGGRVELPDGIIAERVFDELIFSRQGSRPGSRAGSRAGRASHAAGGQIPHAGEGAAGAYQYPVSLPGHGAVAISVPELGRRFCLKVIDWPFAQRDTKSEAEALDADLLRAPLLLRNWRPGDAYRPRGGRQPRKLKQMFLAGRVPRRERVLWPVLESGGSVIWARGMPPAGDFCARENTRLGLVIEEDRL